MHATQGSPLLLKSLPSRSQRLKETRKRASHTSQKQNGIQWQSDPQEQLAKIQAELLCVQM